MVDFLVDFLVDKEISSRIVAEVLCHSQERLVEIGPGVGSLTSSLLQQVKQLWVIEQDSRLIPLLRQQTAGLGQLEIELGDALLVDFRALAQRLGGPLTIVANLPYHISTPLLFHHIPDEQGHKP